MRDRRIDESFEDECSYEWKGEIRPTINIAIVSFSTSAVHGNDTRTAGSGITHNIFLCTRRVRLMDETHTPR